MALLRKTYHSGVPIQVKAKRKSKDGAGWTAFILMIASTQPLSGRMLWQLETSMKQSIVSGVAMVSIIASWCVAFLFLTKMAAFVSGLASARILLNSNESRKNVRGFLLVSRLLALWPRRRPNGCKPYRTLPIPRWHI